MPNGRGNGSSAPYRGSQSKNPVAYAKKSELQALLSSGRVGVPAPQSSSSFEVTIDTGSLAGKLSARA